MGIAREYEHVYMRKKLLWIILEENFFILSKKKFVLFDNILGQNKVK